MLDVPTLWTVTVINFLALGLIWTYVIRSYPKLEAAGFWTASAYAAAAGAALGMARVALDSLVPLVAGGITMVLAACFALMGIERFYDRPLSWRGTALITAATGVAIAYFMFVHDSVSMRILIYSIGQVLPFVLTLRLLFSPQQGCINPGARLAGTVAVLISTIYAVRAGGTLLGFDFAIGSTGTMQSILVLALIFLSMAWNFGCLLMAIDRLRKEVADLALLDDLTGVGNRRQLVQRLSEECARSIRSSEPFALLVIDLDAFKLINDTHGHAAGDACLQHFTLMAQTRLRPGDMLARTGGDEFCIVLPASTVREGALVARRVLDVCRRDAEGCIGADIPIAVSIGVAQWTADIGLFPDRLMANADHALYEAKKEGKNRYAVFEAAPPLQPADVLAPTETHALG